VLAMVAVDHERVVLTVEDDFQDSRHRTGGDWLFLCTLHVEDDLLDAVGGDKSLEIMVGLILLDQRAVARLAFECRNPEVMTTRTLSS
jgi:hypothetical protein